MLKIKLEYQENRVNIASCKLNLAIGVYQLCGPNGSGKTTLLNLITRKIKCDPFEMSYNDINLGDMSTSELMKQYITYVPQTDYLFEHLTALQNIEILAPKFNKEKLNQYAVQLNMTEIINGQLKCKKLSGGERRKLSFIIGLLKNSPILLLDEVDNYVDTVSKQKMLEILKTEKRIIIIISHDELDIADKIYMSDHIEYVSNHKSDIECDIESWTNIFKLKQGFKNTLINGLGILLLLIMILGVYQSISFIDGTLMAIHESDREYSSKTDLIIYPPQINVNYDFYGNKDWLNTTPTAFTQEDYTNLKSLKGVTKVIPLDDPEMGYLCYFVGDDCYTAVDNGQLLDYANIGVPKEVISNINITPYILTSGEFPDDNSQQVAISTEFASENSLKIGDSIALTMEDDKSTPAKDIIFKVSGIYEDYSKGTPLLYAYSDAVMKQRPVSNYDYFQQYDGNGTFNDQQLSDMFKQSPSHYYGFYVKTDSEKSLNEVSKQINDYDMYIENDSAVANQFNFLSKIKKAKVIKQLEGTAVYIVVIILIAVWALKVKYRQMDKSILRVLRQYGYNSEEIKLIVKNKVNDIIVILIVIGYAIWINFQQLASLSKLIFIVAMLALVAIVKIIESQIKGRYENKD